MKQSAAFFILLGALLFGESSQAFELCFAYTHGRCFKTVETSAKRITLQQYGGMSDSEAVITPQEIKVIEKDLSAFYSSVKYAAVKSAKSCGKPLVYKIAKKEEVRCLERIKKPDSEKLLSLISRVSLASKP